MKLCGNCKTPKDESEFYRKSRSDSLRYICKQCHSSKRKEYYKTHKEQELKKNREWEIAHPEVRREIFRKWTNNAKYYSKKRRNDVKYKLKKDISRRLKDNLKDGKGGASTFALLGYNAKLLKAHLTKTMPNGYTWQDYLDGKLHLDHKIPVSVFNFNTQNDLDFKRCWALKNLQLLPAVENLRKADKLEFPFQPSLPMSSIRVDIGVHH